MIESQLEIIAQGKSFLEQISEENYQKIMKPHLAGSAGAHMRHILDHYLALRSGATEGTVDYNIRHRNSPVETSTDAAIQKWQELEQWLKSLNQSDLDKQITVISEMSISETQNAVCQSTVARELIFVSSHAIHHYSLLAVISSLQGNPVDANMGLAPATASYQRQQKDNLLAS